MAVKRALLFRMGDRGLFCAAYEVAFEPGTESHKGTIRGTSDCTKLATEIEQDTGLCAEHAAIVRKSPQLSAVRHIGKG